MQISEKNDEAVLIVESPIEFVLIGTFDNKRVVLAKSRNAKIDLLSSSIKDSIHLDSSIFKRMLGFKINKRPHVVESIYIKKIGMDRYDNLEFVWRGIASSEDIEIIGDILNANASQIYIDLNKKNNKSELEWIISELIYAASELNNKTYQNILREKLVFQFFMVLYFIVALYAVIFLFPK